jgi:hypothetical protein
MNANIVFSIVQALPLEEQRALLKMIKATVSNGGVPPSKNKKLLSRAEADAFILRTVFKNNKNP